MRGSFSSIVDQYKNEFFGFLNYLSRKEKKLLVTGDLYDSFEEFEERCENDVSKLKKYLEKAQEAFFIAHTIYFEVREKIALTRFYRISIEEACIEEIQPKDYLMMKEYFVNPRSNNNILTLNFKPFYDKSPLVRDIKYIGKGVEYLNRFLSSQMFNDTHKWKKLLFNFIRLHKYDSTQLLMNERIKSPDDLNDHIDSAIEMLSDVEPDKTYDELCHSLQEQGFERGLGATADDILKSLKLLDNLLNSPDHDVLTKFISRIPMIFKIAIVSSHGYFAQESVLGKPDTGGQVVYILDQVKALEKELTESLKKAGINVLPKIIILTRLIPNADNTTCDQRLEKVHNTKNSWILRVPFKEHNKNVTDNWISRFEIWPYLEEFAEEAYIALSAEFGGRPDLIIGNYSDGNLVSYLLAKQFKVTQCCIAHALEKSKYLFSALYWQDMEDAYHFSLQFTADLLAINSANFLITSSFQEIAGTEDSIGQYESYKHFSMPGLYRIENGLDLKHTKFNILSPGVNENIYFPYNEKKDRINEIGSSIQNLFFENKEDPEVVGELENPELTPIFSMARLDRIKNITSLVKWFGESEELQKLSNLIIVAGKVDRSQSNDSEEIHQIDLMHKLIDQYNLHEKIRWLGKLFRKDEAGEAYRVIADHKGIFVQPALFEGFGLTVIEAMVSGVPVFATKYGGPLEIIENKRSGFHIDPVDDEDSTRQILEFIKKVNDKPEYWEEISKNSIKRVNTKYNWKLYTEKLLSLAKIYGFWKYLTDMENTDMEAYLDIIYHTLYKPRAKELLEKHNQV